MAAANAIAADAAPAWTAGPRLPLAASPIRRSTNPLGRRSIARHRSVDPFRPREDAADRRIEIKIDHLNGGIASVQCFCHRYIDLLHLIDMPDGWKIVNAVWRLR